MLLDLRTAGRVERLCVWVWGGVEVGAPRSASKDLPGVDLGLLAHIPLAPNPLI